ncbi:enolase C-terminal domain-like protein [Mycobacterium sp. E740]|uniref:enolase C-terminal domain-like protein n=1 Tax=Mycobacterium sp. E740 TaxID=1834149 RepID=UPI0007FEDACE|nr:enolase C-terminal domain-like protein [Mycobacterium sp. E740]OBI84786.1 mandelate racemase [Mycobacterium sp. E740]
MTSTDEAVLPKARAVTPAVAVTGLHAAAYTIPTDVPEADGTLAWDHTTLVVASAECGQVTGTGWTYGHPACVDVIAENLAAHVVGRDALDVGGAFDAMTKAVRNIGRGGIAGQALSAVDVALWDLKARLLGTPLHRLLGAVRDTVPVYGSGGFTTYDHHQLCDQLRGWVHDLGIPRVKIKIGQSWGTCTARDMSRMHQARAVIGSNAQLFVDANGAYTAKQAIRLMSAVDELEVTWLEEPVSSDDLTGLRAVRDAVSADVTAGEYGYRLDDFVPLCAVVDCLQADVSRCGGLTEWQRVAALAAAHHLDISGHCAPWLHASVGAATPNLRHLEWFHDHARIETRYFEGATPPVDGALRPDPASAGHGLAVRSPDLEPYRVR